MQSKSSHGSKAKPSLPKNIFLAANTNSYAWKTLFVRLGKAWRLVQIIIMIYIVHQLWTVNEGVFLCGLIPRLGDFSLLYVRRNNAGNYK